MKLLDQFIVWQNLSNGMILENSYCRYSIKHKCSEERREGNYQPADIVCKLLFMYWKEECQKLRYDERQCSNKIDCKQAKANSIVIL